MTKPDDLSLVKPKLRGVSHQVAAFVAFAATVVLVSWAHGVRGRAAAAIYGVSLTIMYAMSALYHRPTWGPAARQRMRRLDHAGIFLVIAATYTPIGVLVASSGGSALLWIIWIGAALGMLRAVFWVGAPKTLSALLYVALGWAGVFALRPLAVQAGLLPVTMIIIGGLVYSAGAVVYALKRPDPAPNVFGYHEIFHVLVIVASIFHFVCEVRVIDLLRS